jgi:hypothetical protein
MSVQEIPRADIELIDYVLRDGTVSKANHDGNAVIIKTYTEEAPWVSSRHSY